MSKNVNLFAPDMKFNHYRDITADFLLKQNIKGILTDLDDTLVSHNHPEPDEELLSWIKSLKDAGINICIISNNRYKRAAPFAEKIGVAFLCNSLKPSRYFYKKGLEVLNLRKEECAFIGDQIYTDIKGAKKCGIKAFLVEPIGTKSTLFIKLKRKFEKR